MRVVSLSGTPKRARNHGREKVGDVMGEEHVWTVREWLAHGAQRMREHERQWLDEASAPKRVGALELAAIQQRAVARAGRALALYGGVVLADATGMGKTRVALALIWRFLARNHASHRVMLCVPARLRVMWGRALAQANQGRSWAQRVVLVTHHACSHKGMRAWTHDAMPALVVVDEAHRFRVPTTRRYDTLAQLARHAHGVICLSASPVCNGVQDLAALIELFRARGWSSSKMGRLAGEDLSGQWSASTLDMLAREVVIRRTHLVLGEHEAGDALSRPRQRVERLSYEPGPHEQWVWQHLGEQCKLLERALFAGRWGEGLFVELMWRRWESGAQALHRTLDRLLTWHVRALAHHARTGNCLGTPQLRRVFDGGQEVLSFMLDEVPGEPGEELDMDAVARDEVILRALYERVNAAREAMFSCMEGGRIHALCEYVRRTGDRAKVLCFTSSVEAAEGCFDALRSKLGGRVAVGLMTGKGARVTGLGRSDPQQVLERFAPIGQECEGVYARREQIDVLVATDCIAEGVNLQDCACVVLLDLPYSPLGVAQRVGRFVRPGSPHDEVVVVWLRPERWQDSLGMRRRLDRKALAAAQAHVGYGDLCEELFAAPASMHAAPGHVGASEAQDRLERLWRSAPAPHFDAGISLMYQCDAMREVWGNDACVVWVREGSDALGWRHMWWRLEPDGSACRDSSQCVSEMVTWMERGEGMRLTPGLDEPWRARIERAVAERECMLHGLWWAPVRVASGGVQSIVLERVRGVSGSERVSLALATRPLGEGMKRMLAQWLEEPEMTGERLLAMLEPELDVSGFLSEEHDEHSAPPRVEWLSAIYGA